MSSKNMGRNKKEKTTKEEKDYYLRRKNQNRINQRNFRTRRKLLENISHLKTPFEKELKYKEDLCKVLKDIGFNYLITLTLKFKNSVNNLVKQVKKLNEKIDSINRVFFVIENGETNHPHIHLLIQSKIEKTDLMNTLKFHWRRGFIDVRTIYSDNEDLTLEEYLMKEIRVYNKEPEKWWII